MAETTLPEPKTRLERYWKGIYDKATEGGGSNPNYVETIEGTLANPFGQYTAQEIYSSMNCPYHHPSPTAERELKGAD